MRGERGDGGGEREDVQRGRKAHDDWNELSDNFHRAHLARRGQIETAWGHARNRIAMNKKSFFAPDDLSREPPGETTAICFGRRTSHGVAHPSARLEANARPLVVASAARRVRAFPSARARASTSNVADARALRAKNRERAAQEILLAQLAWTVARHRQSW